MVRRKIVVIRAFRLQPSVAVEAAVLMAQAGEFAFVVVALGLSTTMLSAVLAQFATAVVAISMLLTPFLAIGGRSIARLAARREHRADMPPTDASAMTDHVIIGGYGRVGQTIGRLLAAENVPFIALDNNGELVGDAKKKGDNVYFGDAARREFLEHAGAAQARAFVVTVNSARAAERMVAAARRQRPDAPVFARARDPAHAVRLIKLGAREVTPEAVEASLQLGARVLEGLGIPDEAVARRLDEMRKQELGRLGGEESGAGSRRV